MANAMLLSSFPSRLLSSSSFNKLKYHFVPSKTGECTIFSNPILRRQNRRWSHVTKCPTQLKAQNQQLPSKDLWKWPQQPEQLLAYGLLAAGIPLGAWLPDSSWSSTVYFLYLGVWVLYVGSHKSLGAKQTQTLSVQAGILVPLLCSVSLFGFYCLLRFFPDIDLQTFLSAYFTVLGVFAIARNMVDLIATIFPNTNKKIFQTELPKWISGEDEAEIQVSSTAADIAALSIGIAVMLSRGQIGNSFIFNNIIATCVATEILSLISLGSFATASGLLVGLLLYDVFWVFGSSHIFGDNVMVKVATSSAFDGPTKLIFPHLKGSSSLPYSLLGLGDIAIPGLLTSLMLRFDRFCYLNKDKAGQTENGSTQFQQDQIYYKTSLVSFILGLVVAVVANVVSGEAQPALLYLVPCQLVSISVMSLVRSEFSLLLSYKEDFLDTAEEKV